MLSVLDYIESHSSAEPEYLQQIYRDTHLNVLNPHMLSGHVQGRVLSMISHMIHPHHILELGTFTGYSALCLAEGLADDGQVVTLEHNDELEDTIRHNLSLTRLGARVNLYIGDCKSLLCDSSIQQLAPFDLVFMDADKREYCTYLDLIFPLLPVGGWILADNTLWDGHVVDPAYDHDRQTLGLRAFNDRLASDTRFEKVILPLRDGLTIIRKISE